MTDAKPPPSFEPHNITRPEPVLMTYYLIISLLTIVGFPFTIVPLFCKYHTLRYRFDDKGISMSWGVLFRREIYLTYRRIQDIHVTRNVLQRWLGLATIAIQTASGSSKAEISIEGILEAEQLRDFLYRQMRGAKGEPDAGEPDGALQPADDEAMVLLCEIRDELRKLSSKREAAI